MSKSIFIKTSFLLFFIILFFVSFLKADYIEFQPYTIYQPNGTAIHCYVSGDEFFNWLHDKNGYTIIQGTDGYYYYGINNEEGWVIPSAYKVNSINPTKEGIPKWVKISEARYKEKINEMLISSKSSKGPSMGTMANLVVYIRFSGDSEFTTPRSTYDDKLNAPNSLSVRHYFDEVSYGNLQIISLHFPICPLTTNLSYEDAHPRSYYLPYNATSNPNGYTNSTDRTNREHTLLVNAINHIAPQVPTNLNIDIDNDGRVDNVSFMIRGNSGAWADLLWAHRWSLYTQTVYINGKRVYDYTFQPENQTTVRTLCHELFHVVGAPDLYRYSQDGFVPVGGWDLMASGHVHMGAFMKWQYASQDWISSIPEITAPGTYTLNPITSATNNAYKIYSPLNPFEYFVLEYRRKLGTYESNIPGSGLLIYRINTLADPGNRNGPPDEVYIYRPGGTLTQNGTINNAAFSSNTGRTEFNDTSNPPCFYSDNTLAGLDIYNITSADATISFTIGFDSPTAQFEALSPISCTGVVQFYDKSTKSPDTWFWDFGDGHTSTLKDPIHTYTTNGYKTVKLTVSNAVGTDSLTQVNYILINKPNPPQAQNQENCNQSSFTLSATPSAGGDLYWYDQLNNGNLLHIGNTYQTPVINTTTTYYVFEQINSSLQNVGPASNTIGDGAYFNSANTHFLIFDAIESLTIKSVLVYAQTAKNRTIVIKDASDNIICDTTIYLITGQHRLDVNFQVPAGIGYKIECTTPNALLYRNSNGTAYPYTINNLVSIHGNSAGNLDYYYYFYDWDVEAQPCVSLPKEVVAAIAQPLANFAYNNNGLNVQFNNLSQYTTTYQWSFGDGTTSTQVNPSHIYPSEGYYNVSLSGTGPCGTDTKTTQIAVFIAGNNHIEVKSTVLYPNPFFEDVHIIFATAGTYHINIFNNVGASVLSEMIMGKDNFNLDLKHLSNGFYFIQITQNDHVILKQKIIKM